MTYQPLYKATAQNFKIHTDYPYHLIGHSEFSLNTHTKSAPRKLNNTYTRVIIKLAYVICSKYGRIDLPIRKRTAPQTRRHRVSQKR